MTCRQCGQCCHNFIVGLTEGDLKREPQLRGQAVPKAAILKPQRLLDYLERNSMTHVLQKTGSKHPCVFLDETHRCSIYSTRPDVCREYLCHRSLSSLSTPAMV